MTPEKRQWRSLEDLAAAPAARAAAQPEFPGFTNVFEGTGEAEFMDDDPAQGQLHRRKFLTLAAGLGLAGLAGCRRPEFKILPYSAIPDEQTGHVVPGKPTFYATCQPRPGGAVPLLVESHEGRPTKIEGNPKHPCSLGSTDAFAQASILDLYSPDRVLDAKSASVSERGLTRSWDDFDRFARQEAAALVKTQGQGFYVLAEGTNSPALSLLREHIKAVLPEAKWHTYEPVDTSETRKGAELAFKEPLVPRYRFEKARRILALDSDFLGIDPGAIAHGRGFAARRAADQPKEQMSRLYVVEPTYTVTGTMADHRLRLPASQIGGVLVAVAQELAVPVIQPNGPSPVGLPEGWVKAVAKDLAASRGASVVVVGDRQPAWVHALAHAVNETLGAIASGVVEFRSPPAEPTPSRDIVSLALELREKKVRTLLIIGGNPVLNAPANLDFRAALRGARFRSRKPAAEGEQPAAGVTIEEEFPTRTIRLGLFHDHTSTACDWHLPLAHVLESWGDAEAADGSLCCVQPLIAPLNSSPDTPARGGRTALEVLALLTQFRFPGQDETAATASYTVARAKAHELVRRSFAARAGIPLADPRFEAEFNRYKQLGFLPASDKPAADFGFKLGKSGDRKGVRKPKPAAEARVDAARIRTELARVQPVPTPTRESLEVNFMPDYSVYDGRYATNPWLQELPDPITKLVWDNAALISPATAAAFALATGDIVQVAVSTTAIDVPVFVLPGHADWCVTLPFGQLGEMRIGHVPAGGGTNVFPLRKLPGMHFVTGGTLTKQAAAADLVTTQEHGTIPEGREIVKELTAARYAEEAARRHPPSAHEPRVGLAPGELPHDAALEQGFQGGYGNTPPQPLPAAQKQERFPLDLARPERLDSQFQWGMVIDLNTCTGCSACVVACQAENNIPVVGKGEVKRNREMHWIRLDRYFTESGGATADDPRVVSQPVACVHCEQAPCEEVCPVNAAVHSPEGLNMQVYNRCIGTRYCSNACPYKVRRFNWFDFNKRQLDQLRVPTPLADGGAALTRNLTPETLQMQKNPDVTVRMRGVMEKCTYCVQRIERGKYGAKIAAAEAADGRRAVAAAPLPRDHTASAYPRPKDAAEARRVGYDLDALDRVIVPDGLIVPACAQACPTQAITFGNTLDPTSRVTQAKTRAGEYLLLGELNTKPRTSYLPRVRNPNPELT